MDLGTSNTNSHDQHSLRESHEHQVKTDREHLENEDHDYKDFLAKQKSKPKAVNLSQQHSAATKISAVIRGYLARQKHKLLKARKTITLSILSEKIDNHFIQIRISQINISDKTKDPYQGNYIINAHDFTTGANFKGLRLPANLKKRINRWEDILSFVTKLFGDFLLNLFRLI